MSFDYRVQKLNTKGKIISEKHYIRYVDGGQVRLEQPPHSGIFYNEDGTLLEGKPSEAEAFEAPAVVLAPIKVLTKEDKKALAKMSKDDLFENDEV